MSKFEMTDSGPVQYCLGIQVKRNELDNAFHLSEENTSMAMF